MEEIKNTPKSLMALDHADWLFDFLSKIENGKSKSETEQLLLKISKGKIRSNESKSIEMYRYTLTTLELLTMDRNKNYVLTPIGREFCSHYSNNNKNSYQKILRSVLLQNARMSIFFKKYLSIIDERSLTTELATCNDIKQEFGSGTGRTLIMLSEFANMVKIIDTDKLISVLNKKQSPTLQQFSSLVRDTYSKFNNGGYISYLKNKYVEIFEVRKIILANLNWYEYEDFNNLFKQLLEDPLGKNICIYVAAPQWFDEKTNGRKKEDVSFKHNGKIYVFMSITNI